MAELTVLTGVETRDLSKLDDYREIGGYTALEQARGMERQAIIDLISEATLRGRGGAGFPMGRKLSLVPPGLSRTPTNPSRAPSRTARSCDASRIASSRAA